MIAVASLLITACGDVSTTPSAATYVLTVASSNPSSGVSIAITSAANNNTTYETTEVSLTYPSGSSFTLTAQAKSGLNIFSSWSGCANTTTVTCAVTLNSNTTVTANYVAPALTTPTVTVTPWSTSITSVEGLAVTVTVVGPTGSPTPTGAVTLTSGSYNSTPIPLETGSHVINFPAGSLAVGTDTLLASYAPDSASSSIYTAATGTSTPITVTASTTGANTITVDQSTLGPPVSSGLMGLNMVYWYDPSTPAIVPALQSAGITSIRWPGGTAANLYHWAANSVCFSTTPIPAASALTPSSPT